MDAIRAQVADFIRVEEELRQERTRAARRATWVVAGTSLALALLIGGALALATRRRLVRVSGTYRAALSAAEDRAESLRKSAHRLATLHDIDRAILADEDLPSLVGSALRQTERVVPGGDSFVVAFDPAGPRLLGRDRAAEADPALAGPAEATEHDGPKVAPDLEAAAPTPLREHLLRAGHRSCVTVPLDSEGRRFGVLVLADPRKAAFTEEHRQVALEIARQLAIAFRQSAMREQVRRHAADLERRVEERTRELQDSLARVKQLQGLLPICAWCKRVRDGKDYWHQVEHYVAAHTGAQFSHGICPECRAAMEREAHSPAG
jgi:GAF domain-containing protein